MNDSHLNNNTIDNLILIKKQQFEMAEQTYHQECNHSLPPSTRQSVHLQVYGFNVDSFVSL
jgi:hypothetical protein